MPEPILCGPVSRAPLLPKLRGHFAEFLNNASSVGLGILSPSTCVGLRYGRMGNDSGFSRRLARVLRYSFFAPRHASGLRGGFSSPAPPALAPVSPFPAHTFPPRPHSSVPMRYRNLHLLSIGYAFPPRLRPRLTRGRSALPRNPWISGRKDSHLPLATHSGILPSYPSTAPCGTASSVLRMLPYQSRKRDSTASVSCLSPGHFRRGNSRLVSCYALFECMAASEPTS